MTRMGLSRSDGEEGMRCAWWRCSTACSRRRGDSRCEPGRSVCTRREPPRLLRWACQGSGRRRSGGGGTWLGVNARGVMVAVTNRLKSDPPKNRRRGLLRATCSAAPAVPRPPRTLPPSSTRTLRRLQRPLRRCQRRPSSTAATGCRSPSAARAAPHLHDVDDASDRRLGHARGGSASATTKSPKTAWKRCKELCAQPGNPDPPMSLHGDKGGTVSARFCVFDRP